MESPSASATTKKPLSLFQRFKDSKSSRSDTISDEDIKKYTGKSKDELMAWAKTQPGVAGNQPAGKLSVGPASGLGGLDAGSGFGGWGFDAEPKMKFPPQPPKSEKLDEGEH